MSPLQQYLAIGAVAAEAMRPQRVKDLEAFFRDNPHAFLAVEQIISGGAIESAPLDIGLDLGIGAEPVAEDFAQEDLTGGVNEASGAGPEQGPELNLF